MKKDTMITAILFLLGLVLMVVAVARMLIPVQPAHVTVNVLDFGADPTGKTSSSAAVQRAADSIKGNGTVFFPAGTYLLNGVVIDDGTKIRCQDGATLQGYPPELQQGHMETR